MEPQVYTLENGLRVVLVDIKAFPTLSTLLLVGAGSRYENAKNNGVAHFFEHMAFKGSKKYPTSFVISSKIEGLGGVFNAFTSKDHTGYWIKATNDHFEEVLDVISDMVLHPLLMPSEIEREKGVIAEEINLYEDTPYRKVSELFEGLLYQGNPLGFDIAGTKETVSTFTRDTFVEYINKLYHPKNAILIIAGGLTQGPTAKLKVQNYLDIIEEKFSDWENGKKKSDFERVTEVQKSPQILITSKKTEQAHFCLGFRTFPFFDKRKHALALLSAILGGGMSSRLFIEVRERRGLCYYISTGREHYHDVGSLVTQAGVTNNLKKIKESISVILAQHKEITVGKVTQAELERARELVKGRFLLSLEDSFSVANFFGSRQLLEEEIETPQEVIVQIDKVTVDEVVAVAREIVRPERLNFAIIGPIKKGEITVKDLAF